MGNVCRCRNQYADYLYSDDFVVVSFPVEVFIVSASTFVSKYVPTRIIMLVFTSWAVWKVTAWGMWFATDNTRNGMEIAAIVTAVTAPVVALLGYVFKTYSENRT